MKARPQIFDWDDLRIFYALVSTGSMSAAARRIGIGQPTVSRRLENLEARIGARLVTRGADGVELTDIGERIWAMVQIMQSTAIDIERVAHQADKSESGTVRISAPEGVSGYWIARHLPGFVEANPKIHLELTTAIEGENPTENADITLQLSETKRMNLYALEIATLHYVPFVARSYLDLYGAPTGFADVLNHRIADLVSYNAQQNHWPKEAMAIKQMMSPSLTTDSSTTLIEGVKSGALISMLPTYIAQVNPELIHIDMDLRVPIKMWMVYHPDQRRVARVRKTLDWLMEIFDSRRYPWFRTDFVPPAEFGSIETVHVRGDHPKPKSV